MMTTARERVARLGARLLVLPRWAKRSVLVASDVVLLSLTLWLAFFVRFNAVLWWDVYWPEGRGFPLLLIAAPIISVATFHLLSLYQVVTRYIGAHGTLRILASMALSVLAWTAFGFMLGSTGMPRTVILIYGLLGSAAIIASRQIASWVLRLGPRIEAVSDRPVLIWGATAPGIALADALRRAGGFRTVGFIDDTPSLVGQNIAGTKVYRPEKLDRLIARHEVRDVFLALPADRRQERQDIIRRLGSHPVRVKTLPPVEDIASGRVSVSDLRPVAVEDLLGREPVPPMAALLRRDTRGRSVLVTGAGGSIGSEIARQVLRLEPLRLVLLDASETALYEINLEIQRLREAMPAGGGVDVIAVLGSVLDEALVERTIAQSRIETIYHAAAYKHVPIVEANPVVGLENNTFGTAAVARVAVRQGVERVVLVSTDKAVRPTNVMGASKRLAELVFQAEAARAGHATVFTMVRFGNVLDSSGSVVRLFRQQIEAGGPVTVTDARMVRYFMSIPEAAALVVQAGAMAKGGEVFVLDMGEPVKIDDLARSMIRLMGREVRDPAHPHGDIAISYVGMRPGEKLFEELLIGENTVPTDHPRIRRSREPRLEADVLARELEALATAMRGHDLERIRAVLQRTVEGYRPEQRTTPGPDLATWVPPTRTPN